MTEPVQAIPEKKTWEDLEKIPEESRHQLVEGEIVAMGSPSAWHSKLQARLTRIADTAAEEEEKIKGSQGWHVLTEVGVFYDATNVFQHDIAGWRLENMPVLQEAPMHIRPDWVCEILSMNRRRDTILKQRVLHRAGVPYYWIVDLKTFEILILKYANEGYVLLDIVPLSQEVAFLPPFCGEWKLGILIPSVD